MEGQGLLYLLNEAGVAMATLRQKLAEAEARIAELEADAAKQSS